MEVMIEPVHGKSQLQSVQGLLRSYVQELGIDMEFQGFTAEMADLSAKYSFPKGGLYLATVEGQAAGCIALRDLGSNEAEIKRLYVLPKYRGLGIAKRLMQQAETQARVGGFDAIKLDTLDDMYGPIKLYESQGYLRCDVYQAVVLENTIAFVKQL